MRDGALQREHRRDVRVDVARQRLRKRAAREADVEVAVRRLRGAARVHDVQLRRELIAGPEPRLGGERDHLMMMRMMMMIKPELAHAVPVASACQHPKSEGP